MQVENINDTLHELISRAKTIILATVNPQGIPNSSYAPFIMDEDGSFYVFISDIAIHAQNLIANPAASLMVIEDEASSEQIFARRRITLQCSSQEIELETPQANEKIEKLCERHGDIIKSLTDYQDFHLFQLIPSKGRAVFGFGEAYQLDGTDLAATHLDGSGHRKKK